VKFMLFFVHKRMKDFSYINKQLVLFFKSLELYN
jgi:hypothetical protein